MEKEMSDEQIEQLGAELAQLYQSAVSVWKARINSLPLNSKQYNSICKTGKEINKCANLLRNEAEDRGWSDDRVKRVFKISGDCLFN